MRTQTMLKTLEIVIKPVLLVAMQNLIHANWLIIGGAI